MSITLTNGHGWMTDCDRTTGGVEGTWNETEDGSVGTLSVLWGDHFYLYVTSSSGNKLYWVNNVDDIGIQTDTWPYILFRYKTSSTSIKAKIVAEFSSGSQVVLDETSNTSFTVGSATLTSGKTLDHLLVYANQATGWVLYDFFLVCKAPFQFPMAKYGPIFELPPRYALLKGLGRVGDLTQCLGSNSATVKFGCDLNIGTWSRTVQFIASDIIEETAHESNEEPWNWLTTPRWNIKANLDLPKIDYTGGKRLVDLLFREYRLSDGTHETYGERFGLGQS